MDKVFDAEKELRNKEDSLQELKEFNLQLYEIVENAKFTSIEKLNDLLEKYVLRSKEIAMYFESLSNNPKAYNKACIELGKVLDGFKIYLEKLFSKQEIDQSEDLGG